MALNTNKPNDKSKAAKTPKVKTKVATAKAGNIIKVSTKAKKDRNEITTSEASKTNAISSDTKTTNHPKAGVSNISRKKTSTLPITIGLNASSVYHIEPLYILNGVIPLVNKEDLNYNSLSNVAPAHPIKDVVQNDIDHTKHIIVGTSYTYSNTWVLNSNTYSGYQKNSLNQTNISFGYAYSVLIGYDFSKRIAFQSECLINNKQEQNKGGGK